MCSTKEPYHMYSTSSSHNHISEIINRDSDLDAAATSVSLSTYLDLSNHQLQDAKPHSGNEKDKLIQESINETEKHTLKMDETKSAIVTRNSVKDYQSIKNRKNGKEASGRNELSKKKSLLTPANVNDNVKFFIDSESNSKENQLPSSGGDAENKAKISGEPTGNGSFRSSEKNLQQEGKLDLTAAFRIRDIEEEMELARGINPEIDSERLRGLLLDSDRSTAVSQFSDWDDIEALQLRCKELEARVQQQRRDLSALREEYRGMCRKTEQTQEEHFKVETVLRKTIAQEEQQLSVLKREGARLIENEKQNARRLVAILREQQSKADRLEAAIEMCGQQMALAISAMMSLETPLRSHEHDLSTKYPSLENEESMRPMDLHDTSVSSRNIVRHNQLSNVASQVDKTISIRRPGSEVSVQMEKSKYPSEIVNNCVSSYPIRPPNPRRRKNNLGSSDISKKSVTSSNQNTADAIFNVESPGLSKSLFPSHSFQDDDIARSLEALIPETLSVLTDVLGPKAARDFLLSAECYKELLHTLTTTNLSPTSAAMLLAEEQSMSRMYNKDIPDSVNRFRSTLSEPPNAVSRGRKTHLSATSSMENDYTSGPKSTKLERPLCTSHSVGPVQRQRSAATIAQNLWERMREMDIQMEEITTLHHKALKSTCGTTLKKELESMTEYLEKLQQYHRDTLACLQNYKSFLPQPSTMNKIRNESSKSRIKYHPTKDGSSLYRCSSTNNKSVDKKINTIWSDHQLSNGFEVDEPHNLRASSSLSKNDPLSPLNFYRQHQHSQNAFSDVKNKSHCTKVNMLKSKGSSISSSPNYQLVNAPNGKSSPTDMGYLLNDGSYSRTSEVVLPHPPSFAQSTFVSRQGLPKHATSGSSSSSSHCYSSSHHNCSQIEKIKFAEIRIRRKNSRPQESCQNVGVFDEVKRHVPNSTETTTVPASQATTASLTSLCQQTFSRAPIIYERVGSHKKMIQSSVKNDFKTSSNPQLNHSVSNSSIEKRRLSQYRKPLSPADKFESTKQAPFLSRPTSGDRRDGESFGISTGISKLRKQREVLPTVASPILNEGSIIDPVKSPMYLHTPLSDYKCRTSTLGIKHGSSFGIIPHEKSPITKSSASLNFPPVTKQFIDPHLFSESPSAFVETKSKTEPDFCFISTETAKSRSSQSAYTHQRLQARSISNTFQPHISSQVSSTQISYVPSPTSPLYTSFLRAQRTVVDQTSTSSQGVPCETLSHPRFITHDHEAKKYGEDYNKRFDHLVVQSEPRVSTQALFQPHTSSPSKSVSCKSQASPLSVSIIKYPSPTSHHSLLSSETANVLKHFPISVSQPAAPTSKNTTLI